MRKEPGLRKIEVVDGQINFGCLREACPSSCCGPFGEAGSSLELSQIILTDEDVRRIIENGGSHLIELTEDGTRSMKFSEDGMCAALDHGRCSIHTFKPTVCTAYPFHLDIPGELYGITACPGLGSGWTNIEDLSAEVNAAKELREFCLDQINETPDAGS